MLVNEYKPEFQFEKSPENAEFRQFLNLSRTNAQNGLDFPFKMVVHSSLPFEMTLK